LFPEPPGSFQAINDSVDVSVIKVSAVLIIGFV